MTTRHYSIRAADNHRIHLHCWEPSTRTRAVMLVAHGMAEHGERYAPLGDYLAARGIAVHAIDHRGHGKSAATPADIGHYADRDGWHHVIDDLQVAAVHVRNAHPGVPFILLGHSMGSFIAQAWAIEHGRHADALVLSGSNYGSTALYRVARVIARLEAFRQGARGRSALLEFLSFGAFNKPFEPARTQYDWLSRDPAQVDLYVNDPLCGFRVTNQLWIDLLGGLIDISNLQRLARIPRRLPVYVFGGDQDPVGQAGAGLKRLVDMLGKAGLEQVTLRLYPQGRHEMLNDVNRDEVLAGLGEWLEKRVLKDVL